MYSIVVKSIVVVMQVIVTLFTFRCVRMHIVGLSQPQNQVGSVYIIFFPIVLIYSLDYFNSSASHTLAGFRFELVSCCLAAVAPTGELGRQTTGFQRDNGDNLVLNTQAQLARKFQQRAELCHYIFHGEWMCSDAREGGS